MAILNCCSPNGIPTIVIHNKTPSSADSNASGSPDTSSHMMFKRSDPLPPPYTTSFPNGKKHRDANLKHCSPTGIPMMVIHHRQPVNSQLHPLINPPNKNQSILPRHPTILYLHSSPFHHSAHPAFSETVPDIPDNLYDYPSSINSAFHNFSPDSYPAAVSVPHGRKPEVPDLWKEADPLPPIPSLTDWRP